MSLCTTRYTGTSQIIPFLGLVRQMWSTWATEMSGVACASGTFRLHHQQLCLRRGAVMTGSMAPETRGRMHPRLGRPSRQAAPDGARSSSHSSHSSHSSNSNSRRPAQLLLLLLLLLLIENLHLHTLRPCPHNEQQSPRRSNACRMGTGTSSSASRCRLVLPHHRKSRDLVHVPSRRPLLLSRT